MATLPKTTKAGPQNYGARQVLGLGYQPWATVRGKDHAPAIHFPSEAQAVKSAKHLYEWHMAPAGKPH